MASAAGRQCAGTLTPAQTGAQTPGRRHSTATALVHLATTLLPPPCVNTGLSPVKMSQVHLCWTNQTSLCAASRLIQPEWLRMPENGREINNSSADTWETWNLKAEWAGCSGQWRPSSCPGRAQWRVWWPADGAGAVIAEGMTAGTKRRREYDLIWKENELQNQAD